MLAVRLSPCHQATTFDAATLAVASPTCPPLPPPAAATGHDRPDPNPHAITTDDPDLLLDLVRGAAIQVEATAVSSGNIELTQFEGELLSFTSGRLEVPIL